MDVDLGTLSERELLVLVGLVKLVVHADREVTPAEREALAVLQATVGPGAWNAAVRMARQRYASIDQLEHDARAVERPEVRRALHEVLSEIAGADEIIDAEAHVLQWVVQEWGLHEDGGTPIPADDFVVLDDD